MPTKLRLISTIVLLAALGSARAYADQQTSPSSSPVNPNAISIELLGRGGLYSIDFDHMISNTVALGIGFSSWSFTFIDTESVLIIPIYANFYSSPDTSRFFLTAGIDFIHASVTDSSGFGDGLSFTGSGVGAMLGGGYEFRGTGGFLFRAAPYLALGSGGAAVTGGLSFGYAF